MMNRTTFKYAIALLSVSIALRCGSVHATGRQEIKAIWIPLADHYALLVAHDNYRAGMQHADLKIKMMKSWPTLEATFKAGKADIALIICPLAMKMYAENPNFHWVSLAHRDGNALAINNLLAQRTHLAGERIKRRPTSQLAQLLMNTKHKDGTNTCVAVPSLYATHTVILAQWLKEYGITLGLGKGGDVTAIAVAPPKAPGYLKVESEKGNPAAFEQSLPWADVVETHGFGKVAWYSKDVIQHESGHVECIVIASDRAIANKREALAEVIEAIHKAGADIERAREAGGPELDELARRLNKHVPQHTVEAIKSSLAADLMVINYRHLNVDKAGLNQIMTLALDTDVIKTPIDIDEFADDSFGTTIGVAHAAGTSHAGEEGLNTGD